MLNKNLSKNVSTNVTEILPTDPRPAPWAVVKKINYKLLCNNISSSIVMTRSPFQQDVIPRKLSSKVLKYK